MVALKAITFLSLGMVVESGNNCRGTHYFIFSFQGRGRCRTSSFRVIYPGSIFIHDAESDCAREYYNLNLVPPPPSIRTPHLHTLLSLLGSALCQATTTQYSVGIDGNDDLLTNPVLPSCVSSCLPSWAFNRCKHTAAHTPRESSSNPCIVLIPIPHHGVGYKDVDAANNNSKCCGDLDLLYCS